MHRSIFRLAFIAAAAASATQAWSAGEIQRKPGLWDIKTSVMGMNTAMKQCVGPGSDDLMARAGAKQHPECGATDIKHRPDGISFHAVCKMEGRTITSDGVFTGSFETAYKGTVTSVMEPPQNGISKTEINMDARWTGPCAAGQKPGDMVISTPGGGNRSFNMNDPKMQEMMNKMRAAQGQAKP